MTIPTTGKGLMLERMTRIFTGKGCRVHAANAFLNHVHVLVEIPNSGDFSKIVNKVKGATGTVYQKTPEYADFSGWAAGFDSFSVSFSDLHRLRRHIEEQHTIHQEISFEEEYGQLLEENGFDPHQTSVPASSTVHFSANTHPKTESNDLYEIHTFLATARLSVRIVRAGNHTTHPPDRRGHGVGQTPDERNRRAEDEVRLARTEREHCLIDGRHSDVQFVRVRQELRTRHALHRCFPRHVAQPHAGDVERHAHQQSHAGYDRLFHHTVLLHRSGLAASWHVVGE